MPRGTFADTKRAIAGIITAVSLTLTGALTASGIVTGSSFVGTGTATSTFAGSVSTTRLVVNAGSAGVPGIAFSNNSSLNTGIYAETGARLNFAISGSQKLLLDSGTLYPSVHVTPAGDNTYDLGATGAMWNDGWFGGFVSSSIYNVADRVNFGASTIRLEHVTGSSQMKITQGTVNWLTFSAGSGRVVSENLFIGSSGILSNTDGVGNLGSGANRINNGWFAGTVTTTNLNVASSSSATATYYVCADANGNIYKKTTACN